MFINFWQRDRAWAGEQQRERETQNPKQAPGSELESQMQGWNSELWDHDLSWSWMLNWLSHPGAPIIIIN